VVAVQQERQLRMALAARRVQVVRLAGLVQDQPLQPRNELEVAVALVALVRQVSLEEQRAMAVPAKSTLSAVVTSTDPAVEVPLALVRQLAEQAVVVTVRRVMVLAVPRTKVQAAVVGVVQILQMPVEVVELS
jgi:hypothetical protein